MDWPLLMMFISGVDDDILLGDFLGVRAIRGFGGKGGSS